MFFVRAAPTSSLIVPHADNTCAQGEAEVRILAYAEESGGSVQACIAKSGFINAPGKVVPKVPGLPTIELRDISAALLDQAIKGFEKDTLFSDDMTRISQKALVE